MMEKGAQKPEWSNAQEITFSIDLFGAAKQQLRFLAAVDRNGSLYDGPALKRAIYRYKNCWLPLLAKHVESSVLEGGLVVPLDCEWIWHCHRLNPLQYKRDCEEIYGRILGTLNVLSTVEGHCSKQSEFLWNKIYVTEPYNLDLANESPLNGDDDATAKAQIDYDFVDAVKRQSSFFGKVSSDMNGTDVDHYLEEAVARYKAFLYMTKTVRESNTEFYCVPTRDIDLIWHTHQLYPLSYCKDLKATVGSILDHNDRDIGTEEGEKMAANWLSKTTQQWQETFGNMYGVAHQKSTGHARCWCLVADEEKATKEQARCWCLVAGEESKAAATKQEARCWCLVADEGSKAAAAKQEARCWCLVAAGEESKPPVKQEARCWCLVAAGEEINVPIKEEARCWCLVAAGEESKAPIKEEARCWCLVAAGEGSKVMTKEARCWCLLAAGEGSVTADITVQRWVVQGYLNKI